METNEYGVVNPLGAPEPIRALATKVAALPLLAKLFGALAAIDVAVGVVQSRGLTLFVVAEAVPLLLPVAVLWRGPERSVPAILRGVVLVAIVPLCGRLAEAVRVAVVGETLDDESLVVTSTALVSVLLLLVSTAGWWLVARGLARLRRGSTGGIRAAAIALAVVLAGASFVPLLITGVTGGIEPGQFLVGAAWGLSLLVGGYRAFVFVSRAGAAPLIARWSIALAIVAEAGGLGALAAVGALSAALRDERILEIQGPFLSGGSTALVASSILVVVAFAFGLADPATASDAPTPG